MFTKLSEPLPLTTRVQSEESLRAIIVSLLMASKKSHASNLHFYLYVRNIIMNIIWYTFTLFFGKAVAQTNHPQI